MKKIRFAPMTLAMTMALCATVGCGGGASSDDQGSAQAGTADKPMVLKLSTNFGDTDFEMNPAAMGLQKFADLVAEKSEGALTVEIYGGSTLAKSTADECIGGVETGTFEMFSLSPSNWGGYTDAYTALNVPYLFSNGPVAQAFTDSELGLAMDEDFLADTGMMNLGNMHLGFRQLTANYEIRTPADMKGLKIRTQSDIYQMAAMEALGAVPTAISFSELFTSLQQKLVDAQENPLTIIYTNKLYEVQKYVIMSNHNYQCTSLIIGADVFNSLPAEYQTILDEAGHEADLYSRDLIDTQEEIIRKDLEEYVTFVELTTDEFNAFRDTASTSWSVIAEDVGQDYIDDIYAEVQSIEAALN